MVESAKAPLQFLTESNLRHGFDLLVIGYKHYRDGLDDELAKAGLGQAHHRAIYFIRQSPNLSPGELTELLGVSKQSLYRVMVDLRDNGFVAEKRNGKDGRAKHLYLTDEGLKLEQRLFESSKARMKTAYSKVGPDAVQGFWNILHLLAGEGQNSAYEALQSYRTKL